MIRLLEITLLVLVGAAAFGMAATAFVAALAFRSARRRLTISNRSLPPPLHWLVSPRTLPQLHRRCRYAARTVRLRYPEPRRRSPERHAFAPLADRLVSVASGLANEVVQASLLPSGPRRLASRSLQSRVAELETAAHALLQAGVDATGPDQPGDPARLQHDLDLVDAARRELDLLAPLP